MNVFDVITIGSDRGGRILAAEFAEHGQKVAVVGHSDKVYGSTCTNIGCIPTKALVHQVKITPGMKGLTSLKKREFYRNVVSAEDSVTGILRNKSYHNLVDNPHVTVYTGLGSFVFSDTVSARTAAEELLLTAKQIIINTGAETIIPSINDIADNPFVCTSTSIMEPTDLPCHPVIIGGGYIGLEFVFMYASFGSQMTVLENYPELITREDRDTAASAKETLEKKGIVSRMNTKVQSADHTSEKATVAFAGLQTSKAFESEADTALLAIGHRPNTQGLHLEATGVEVDVHGAIIVDEYLKTANPAVRAVGDVRGGLQFTHISPDSCRIIRDDLFGDAERRASDYNPVSYSVFTDPPLARVGLNEKEVRKQNLDIIVKKLPVMAVPRAKTLGEAGGPLKTIIDKKTGLTPGCMLSALDSSEVINTATFAVKAEQDYIFLCDFIFTHPSMGEALNDLSAQQHFSIYS